MIPIFSLTNENNAELEKFAKIVPTDVTGNDNFGYSVALSGDGNTIIIGAFQHDTAKGSAYIYIRNGNTWIFQSKLLPIDNTYGDYFGVSVSLSYDGNTAIIGAHGDDSVKGSAYIFIRNTNIWTEQSKLVAGDGITGDHFGYAVDISGDGNTAIISAYVDDGYKGSVYIFSKDGITWNQHSKLIPINAEAGDVIGYSVGIDYTGNTVIISSHGNDTASGVDTGSAYVFSKISNIWTEQIELITSDATTNDVLGVSVSISGDGNTILVGVIGDDGVNGADTGSAYIFRKNNNIWTEQEKIVASDLSAGDLFGYSVNINYDGSMIIIGSYNDPLKTASGNAYVFEYKNNNWIQHTKLSSTNINDRFGFSSSISDDGNIYVVGAYQENNSGSVYLYIK